jgi:hypothetical protein
LTIRYGVQNSGNILPSSGTVRLEIKAPDKERPLYTKQFPLAFGIKTIEIQNPDLKQGSYKLYLTASAAADQLRDEFLLSEKPLTVSGPVHASRLNTPFPRVLVWLGRDGRIVEQAVSEALVKQAFEQKDLYYKVVDSEEEFSSQAMTGIFNAYILLEPQEMPLKAGLLKDKIDHGDGIVIIGSGRTAQNLAEDLGFTFQEATTKKSPVIINFNEHAGLGLSGTMPVSGKILYPRKKGTTSAAVYSSPKQPAALIDLSRKGKLLVMPISLSQSAYHAGTTGLYSLVLRSAGVFAAGDTLDAAGPGTGVLSISSPEAPCFARIREVLPPGSIVLWTSADGKAEKNIITFEVKADKEPRTLMYLYRPSLENSSSPAAEIYYQCGDTFMSQGKME